MQQLDEVSEKTDQKNDSQQVVQKVPPVDRQTDEAIAESQLENSKKRQPSLCLVPRLKLFYHLVLSLSFPIMAL